MYIHKRLYCKFDTFFETAFFLRIFRVFCSMHMSGIILLNLMGVSLAVEIMTQDIEEWHAESLFLASHFVKNTSLK
jgi:hypothetical protein